MHVYRCENNAKFFDRNDIIMKNIKRSGSDVAALEYFDSMASYTDELRKIQRSLRVHLR